MLNIEITENGTGIYISGDYEDLFALREAISSLAGDKTSYEGYEEVHSIVQHFAFELLHAYRAERDVYKTNCDTPCYKFPIMFPEAFFVADALNDYIILSESSQYYVDKMEEKNSSVAQKIKEKKYINKAYIRFFQASVYDAIRRYIGEEELDKIEYLTDSEKICSEGNLRYKDFCKDWVDILNIRYINDGAGSGMLVEAIKKLAVRDEEYISKERAMKEHSKDGNISLFFGILEEVQYPDEWEW